MRRGRGGDDDVARGDCRIAVGIVHDRHAVVAREVLRAFGTPVAGRNRGRALFGRDLHREGARLAAADDEDSASQEAGAGRDEVEARPADGRRNGAEVELGADAFRARDGVTQDAVQLLADRACGLRRGIGFLELAEDLVFAEDHGFES